MATEPQQMPGTTEPDPYKTKKYDPITRRYADEMPAQQTIPGQPWMPGQKTLHGQPTMHAQKAEHAQSNENPYWQTIETFFEEENESGLPWADILTGTFLGAVITAGAIFGYRFLENAKESPFYKKMAGDCVDPSQLELKVEDIDHTGVKRTILRYDGKAYLFMLGKDDKPEMRPYSVQIEQANHAAEKNQATEKPAQPTDKPVSRRFLTLNDLNK